MAGGLLQLAAYGTENQYLNGNPQMTFFKMVYRRYTNFAMQSIEVPIEGLNTLSMDKTTVMKVRIPRNADLFSKMFLVFDLPDIYVDSNSGQQFRWIAKLGSAIINWVKIYIGGTLIEQLFGEYIDIYHELTVPSEKFATYQLLTGDVTNKLFGTNNNIASEYNFMNDETLQNVELSSNKYRNFVNRYFNVIPTIEGFSVYLPLPFWFSRYNGLAVPLVALQYHEITLEIEFKAIRDLYIIGINENVALIDSYYNNSLPDSNNVMANPQKFLGLPQTISRIRYIRPSTSNYDIKNYTRLTDNPWALNTRLEINYIFLDDEERKSFALNSHQYLIEKVDKKVEYGKTGMQTIELELFHPVKEIIVTARRDDVRNRNAWTHYLNSDIDSGTTTQTYQYGYQSYYFNICKQLYDEYMRDPSQFPLLLDKNGIDITTYPPASAVVISPFYWLGMFRTDLYRSGRVEIFKKFFPPLDVANQAQLDAGKTTHYRLVRNKVSITEDELFISEGNAYTMDELRYFLGFWQFRNAYEIPAITLDNYKFFSDTIINNIEIRFNGNIRLDQKENIYFSTVQPYIHHSRNPRPGILCYSFSLEPEKYQPSGACNFSHIKKIEFIMDLKNPRDYEVGIYKTYSYDINFYVISYNVLQIMGGMGSIMYGN